MGSLLADEFVEFGSSGRVFDNQQIIDALRGEVRTSLLSPEFVLVRYQLASSDSDGEAPECSLGSSVWKLIGKRWQMVFPLTLPKEKDAWCAGARISRIS